MKVSLLSVVLVASSMLFGCGGAMEATIVAAPEAVTLAEAEEVGATPFGSVTSTGLFMSPAQVRTRYGFDGLPNTPAAQGSGQLIAIISTYDNPDLVANLQAFSERYNLPQCTEVKTVYTKPPGSYTQADISHPMPGAPCTIQVVNVDSFGRPTTAKHTSGPATADWMMESSMDIEWAHAIAPQASILVVQAPSIFVGALGNAAKYASDKGANVVSMSWGINESSKQCTRKPGQPTVKYVATCNDADVAAKYWQSVDTMFAGTATFVAASGDRAVLQWPSISPKVLAVGGTNASGPNSKDTAWTHSGGGVSKSFPAPMWQSNFMKVTNRNVPDVSLVAGTLVAVYIKPNAKTGFPDTDCVATKGAANCGWYGGGGTSAATPMWGGIVAVTNAMRAIGNMKGTDYVSSLYTNVASVNGTYASSMEDVIVGAHANNGYDISTGLGVPNANNLINYMASR